MRKSDISPGPRFTDRPIAAVVILGPLLILLVAVLAIQVLRPAPSWEGATEAEQAVRAEASLPAVSGLDASLP